MKKNSRSIRIRSTSMLLGKGEYTASCIRRSAKKSRFPWEGKREDKKTEQFNLRLSECELEKLRFISANTPLSMQSFIRNTLTAAIEKKIKTLLRG